MSNPFIPVDDLPVDQSTWNVDNMVDVSDIPDNRPPATPSLWNTRYEQINRNFAVIYELFAREGLVDLINAPQINLDTTQGDNVLSGEKIPWTAGEDQSIADKLLELMANASLSLRDRVNTVVRIIKENLKIDPGNEPLIFWKTQFSDLLTYESIKGIQDVKRSDHDLLRSNVDFLSFNKVDTDFDSAIELGKQTYFFEVLKRMTFREDVTNLDYHDGKVWGVGYNSESGKAFLVKFDFNGFMEKVWYFDDTVFTSGVSRFKGLTINHTLNKLILVEDSDTPKVLSINIYSISETYDVISHSTATITTSLAINDTNILPTNAIPLGIAYDPVKNRNWLRFKFNDSGTWRIRNKTIKSNVISNGTMVISNEYDYFDITEFTSDEINTNIDTFDFFVDEYGLFWEDAKKIRNYKATADDVGGSIENLSVVRSYDVDKFSPCCLIKDFKREQLEGNFLTTSNDKLFFLRTTSEGYGLPRNENYDAFYRFGRVKKHGSPNSFTQYRAELQDKSGMYVKDTTIPYYKYLKGVQFSTYVDYDVSPIPVNTYTIVEHYGSEIVLDKELPELEQDYDMITNIGVDFWNEDGSTYYLPLNISSYKTVDVYEYEFYELGFGGSKETATTLPDGFLRGKFLRFDNSLYEILGNNSNNVVQIRGEVINVEEIGYETNVCEIGYIPNLKLSKISRGGSLFYIDTPSDEQFLVNEENKSILKHLFYTYTNQKLFSVEIPVYNCNPLNDPQTADPNIITDILVDIYEYDTDNKVGSLTIEVQDIQSNGIMKGYVPYNTLGERVPIDISGNKIYYAKIEISDSLVDASGAATDKFIIYGDTSFDWKILLNNNKRLFENVSDVSISEEGEKLFLSYERSSGTFNQQVIDVETIQNGGGTEDRVLFKLGLEGAPFKEKIDLATLNLVNNFGSDVTVDIAPLYASYNAGEVNWEKRKDKSCVIETLNTFTVDDYENNVYQLPASGYSSDTLVAEYQADSSSFTGTANQTKVFTNGTTLKQIISLVNSDPTLDFVIKRKFTADGKSFYLQFVSEVPGYDQGLRMFHEVGINRSMCVFDTGDIDISDGKWFAIPQLGSFDYAENIAGDPWTKQGGDYWEAVEETGYLLTGQVIPALSSLAINISAWVEEIISRDPDSPIKDGEAGFVVKLTTPGLMDSLFTNGITSSNIVIEYNAIEKNVSKVHLVDGDIANFDFNLQAISKCKLYDNRLLMVYDKDNPGAPTPNKIKEFDLYDYVDIRDYTDTSFPNISTDEIVEIQEKDIIFKENDIEIKNKFIVILYDEKIVIINKNTNRVQTFLKTDMIGLDFDVSEVFEKFEIFDNSKIVIKTDFERVVVFDFLDQYTNFEFASNIYGEETLPSIFDFHFREMLHKKEIQVVAGSLNSFYIITFQDNNVSYTKKLAFDDITENYKIKKIKCLRDQIFCLIEQDSDPTKQAFAVTNYDGEKYYIFNNIDVPLNDATERFPKEIFIEEQITDFKIQANSSIVFMKGDGIIVYNLEKVDTRIFGSSEYVTSEIVVSKPTSLRFGIERLEMPMEFIQISGDVNEYSTRIKVTSGTLGNLISSGDILTIEGVDDSGNAITEKVGVKEFHDVTSEVELLSDYLGENIDTSSNDIKILNSEVYDMMPNSGLIRVSDRDNSSFYEIMKYSGKANGQLINVERDYSSIGAKDFVFMDKINLVTKYPYKDCDKITFPVNEEQLAKIMEISVHYNNPDTEGTIIPFNDRRYSNELDTGTTYTSIENFYGKAKFKRTDFKNSTVKIHDLGFMWEAFEKVETEVTFTSVQDGSTIPSTRQSIGIFFSNTMDVNSVESAITLTDNTAASGVPLLFTWASSYKTVYITPDVGSQENKFVSGHTYQLDVSVTAIDSGGEPIKEAVSITFDIAS